MEEVWVLVAEHEGEDPIEVDAMEKGISLSTLRSQFGPDAVTVPESHYQPVESCNSGRRQSEGTCRRMDRGTSIRSEAVCSQPRHR